MPAYVYHCLQYLFHKDAEYLGVSPDVLKRLQDSNPLRFKILAKLLKKLGIECSTQSQPDLTPAILLTKDQVRIYQGCRNNIPDARLVGTCPISHLRIEFHILSLHWMMKNISYFNAFSETLKIANVFHNPVQA